MKKRRSAFLLEKLEPRLLFSADLALLPLDGAALAADQDVLLTMPAQLSSDSEQVSESVEQVQREVIFIDAGIEDYQQLLDDIQAQAAEGRQFETVLLDINRDGIAQVSDYLSSQQDISAVHILSHGSDGEVVLGGSPLNLATLDSYAEAIEGWQNSLTEDADLLFYGCNLASGEAGQSLISSLALLTGADVAASDDLTGVAALGGDWELEETVGQVETDELAPQDQWQGTLATINVTSFNDLADGGVISSINDLQDTPGTDGISLREAIIAANNTVGADTINLLTGTYTLAIGGIGEDLAATGDLDINSDITLIGAGAEATSIDANFTDRVFDVGNVSFTIENLTIENGWAGLGAADADGGAISTGAGAVVTLDNVVLRNNEADNGGALNIINSSLTVNNVTFDDNQATSSAGALRISGTGTIENSLFVNNQAQTGGAIASQGATLTLTNSTFSGNQATAGSGGAIDNNGTLTLNHVTIAENQASAAGGGIDNRDTTNISNSIIANNTAASDPDVSGTFVSSGDNLIESVGTATGFAADITGVDPNLAPLADNGGPTQTYALLTGSAAIDTANRATMSTTDQRGFLRSDGAPDIGAYELGATAAGTADYLDQFNAIAFDGDDGTLPWSNDWQEIGESNGAAYSGPGVSVYDRMTWGRGLYLINTPIGVWREADLSGADTATLNFDWAAASLGASDSITVEISTDGGLIWDVIDTFGSDSALQSVSYDISSYIDSDTRIKFESTVLNGEFFVDNVQITLTSLVDNPATFSGDSAYSGNEGDTGSGDLDANDADGLIDGSYFTIKTQGTFGSANIDAETGIWSYTPSNLDWSGSDGFTVTVTDDLGGTTDQLINIDLAPVNDVPTMSVNTLTISQGETVNIDNTMLLGTDVDNTAAELTFTVTAVTNGHFAYATDTVTPITTFTQAEINTPATIVFVHDGGELEPTYSINVSDGSATSADLEATVTFTDTADGVLWLSLNGDEHTGSDIPGVNSEDLLKEHVLQVANPDFSLGKTTTDGTFSVAFDINNFSTDANINGLHYVTSEVIIGGVNPITLQKGDLLLTSADDNKTLTSNGVSSPVAFDVDKDDIFFFRPDQLGDYSVGNFYNLLTNPANAEVRGMTLVEKDVYVGDTWLSEGDILLSTFDGAEDNDIWLLKTDTLDTAISGPFTLNKLIEGDDISLTDKIYGLDVLEDDTAIGGQNYDAGTLLFSIDADDTGTGADDGIGTNMQEVTQHDIGALSVSQTNLGSPTTVADTTIMFDGSTVNFDSGNEKLDGFTLTVDVQPANAAPTLVNNQIAVVEGQTTTLTSGMLSASDADDADNGLVFNIVTIGGGQFELSGDPGVEVFSFTQGQITAGEVLFVDDGDENAPTFTLNVSDGVNTTTTVSGGVNFANVNDAPNLDASGTLILTNVLENNDDPTGNTVATILSSDGGDPITDVDNGAVEGIAVIGVDNSNGTWEYSLDDGVNWLSFTANGVADGAIDEANAIVLDPTAQIRFVPATDYSGSVGDITFRGWDQTDGLLSGTDSVNVSLNGVATPYSAALETAALSVVPSGTLTTLLPSGQNVDEDTALVFSTANGNAITVDDGSTDDSILRTTLTVTNGTITLASLTGITIESGGNGTSTMTIVGLESDINAALDGLIFSHPGDFNGAVNLQVTTDLMAGLEGYYSFDDTLLPGSDDSPDGLNSGTVDGATSFTDGTRGEVLGFDGDDFVQVTGNFGDPASVTLSTWVNLDAGRTNDTAISLGDNVSILLDDTAIGTGVTGFFYDGFNWQHTSSSTDIAGTGWHHVAYSIDNATNTQTIYIDGVSVATTNHLNPISYSLGNDTYLGIHGDGGTLTNLLGALDDARIYSRVLSAGEVALLSQDQISYTASVAITVDPVNDAGSFGGNIGATIDEDTSAGGNLSFSDTADGATSPNYRIEAGDEASNGSATIDSGTGAWTYTPAANFNGSDSFTVSVSDDDNHVETQLINITVDPLNDAGSFTGDISATIDEDTSAGGNLSFSDTADGATSPNYRIEAGDEASNGSATIDSGTGAWTYTPAANFNGSDSFTVSVSDDDNHVETQLINITVDPLNDAGSFTGDISATIDEDTSAGGNLSFSDTADGATSPNYRIEAGDEASNGSATIDSGTGAWTYTPAANFNGSDSFTVSVSDDDNHVETQLINITVDPLNDAGSFTGDISATIDEDTSAGGNLSFSDTADGATSPNYRIEAGDEASNGSATIDSGTGAWTYTPTANFNGSDSFTVSVSDDDNHVETQLINITVDPLNDAGSFTGDISATIDEDTSAGGNLSFSDTADGATSPNYRIEAGDEASNGSATIDSGTGAWTYTPTANFNGSDSFTVSVSDDDNHVETQLINITVDPLNDAGSFTGDISATIDEDTSAGGNLSFSDTADGATSPNYRIEAGDEASNGSATIDSGTGAWTYTPAANFNGSDSFTVSVSDDDNHVETQLINITVDPLNDAGSFTGDISATIDEDTSAGGNLSFSDTADGATSPNYRIEAGDEASNGSATIDSGTGAWTYTPAANFNGSDSFTVSVSDDDNHVETQLINITVDPLNDAGSFTGDISATIDEDTSAGGNLSFSDTADGATSPNYRIEAGDEASNGSATIDSGTGAWTYTPAANFNGSDSFTVSVSDDDNHVETQLINITVDPLNDAGSFTGDISATIDEDTSAGGNLSFSDTADGATSPNYRIEAGDEASNGSATIDSGTGAWTYTPAANFNGSDSFTVSVSDDDNHVETQLINITVDPLNDAGSFTGDISATIDEDTSAGGNLSFSDTADGATSPNYRIEAGDEASNGSATIDSGTGAWTYTPTTNVNGADSFTVQVTDDAGNVETQVISITVNAVADLGAMDDSFSTNEDTALVDSVATNDSTSSGGTLSYALDSDVSDGVLTLNATGSFTYTPNANFNGSDSFRYIVTDADSGESSTQNVSITINPINDTPIITSTVSITVDEDSPYTYTMTVDDVDSGDVLNLSAPTLPAWLSFNTTTGVLSGTPSNAEVGEHSVVLRVNDGTVDVDQSFTITVNGVNDAPTAVNDNLSVAEDHALTVTTIADLLHNDSDPEGDSLTLSAFTQPTHGTLVDHGDGTLTYTPDSNFSSTDSFDYTISDGNGGTASGTAFIYVTPVGDTPQVADAVVLEGVQSDPITISRHVADSAEVTHFRISAISGGTLYLADGVTQVNNGDYISVAQGQAGLRFSPSAAATEGSFQVESSEDGMTVAAQSGKATSTITVTALPLTTVVEVDVAVEVEESVEEIVEEEGVEEDTSEVVESQTEPQVPLKENSNVNTDSEKNSSRNAQVNPILSFIQNIGSANENESSLGTPRMSTLQSLNVFLDTTPIETLRNAWNSLDIGTLSARDYNLVRSSFDALQQEMNQENKIETAVVSSAIATTMGLSAGYVVWMLKGGSLLASMLSSMPAWHLADPLSILGSGKLNDDDDESLESIIKEGEKKAEKKDDE